MAPKSLQTLLKKNNTTAKQYQKINWSGTFDEYLKIPLPAFGSIRVPYNHLHYAISWFSLALGLIFVYFAWHRQNGFLKIN